MSGLDSPNGSRIKSLLLENSKVVFVESVLSILLLWAVLSHVFDLTDVISSPWLVGLETYELLVSMEWVEHVYVTLRRIVYAFIVTVLIGTVLGVAMGLSTFWEKALQDYITLSLALPTLFAVIFAAMWFGVSDLTPIVAGAIISFPYITQNIYEGAKNIDRDLFEMTSSFDVSRRRALHRVVFKSIMAEWFAGIRYSFAICWKVVTLAELVVAQNGIGYMIAFEMQRLSLTGVLAWAVLFTVIMLFVEYAIFQQTEKRVFDWRQDTSIGWA